MAIVISLESYCVIRIALAEKMLRSNDPRLKAAFDELRREMFAETTQSIIAASRAPALLRAQI